MNKELNYLFELIKAVLNNQEIKFPTEKTDWDKLYNLAKKHSISAIVFAGIEKLPEEAKPNNTIYQKFKQAAAKSYTTEAIQYIEGNRIFDYFEKNSINFIPLKGWLLRQYYPHPALRSMSDIDILIRDEQSQKVHDIMIKLGYDVKSYKEGNHDVYIKPPYMNIEIHRALFIKEHGINDYFTNIWSRVILNQGHYYRYNMSYEDNFIYMLAHINKHFSHGGTGIRSVIDIWLYLNNFQTVLDWEYINKILKQESLLEISKQIITIGQSWFSNKQDNLYEKEIENFIIASGTYGNITNILTRTLIKTDGNLRNKKYKYYFNRIFAPLKQMKKRYPILKKHPYLIIYYWFIRIITAIFSAKKRIYKEFRTIKNIDEQKIYDINKIDLK